MYVQAKGEHRDAGEPKAKGNSHERRARLNHNFPEQNASSEKIYPMYTDTLWNLD